jgi:hypothetical protein
MLTTQMEVSSGRAEKKAYEAGSRIATPGRGVGQAATAPAPGCRPYGFRLVLYGRRYRRSGQARGTGCPVGARWRRVAGSHRFFVIGTRHNVPQEIQRVLGCGVDNRVVSSVHGCAEQNVPPRNGPNGSVSRTNTVEVKLSWRHPRERAGRMPPARPGRLRHRRSSRRARLTATRPRYLPSRRHRAGVSRPVPVTG